MEYGKLTAPNIGVIMRSMADRAMAVIYEERNKFIATPKIGYDGELTDVKSSGDTKAQEIYAKMIRENFPEFGVIAEEDDLRIECTLPSGENMFFTVDPLDGTKAYVRRQSHGIGTMIALVHNNKVIGACVGDIMTGELFYFRPESNKAHRLGRTRIPEELPSPVDGSHLGERYALLRDQATAYHPVIQRIVADHSQGGLMHGNQITDGSIGISMSRLWKDEVGMAVLKAGYQTPWDWAPVVGISEQLGYEFFMTSTSPHEKTIMKFDPDIPLEPIQFNNDIIVVHKNYVEDLQNYVGLLGKE